ncbi:MAG: flagellar hook protein FliD [Treponema sp.]|nr:MAG: flagellar hook protein FliD [Treponema sp.]
MSDMSIPGISGNYDKYIDSLMKVERIPRDNVAKDLEKFELQKNSWRQINRLSSDLRKASNDLYSFNNPFAEKIVSSTNERAVTATAKRDAKEQSFKIKVNAIANSDSFLTSEIDKDLNIPEGKYTFLVGEKTISFNWRGGRYRDFIELINRRGKDILRVTEVKTTSETTNLLFKSEISGAKNRLKFADDALNFALQHNLIKKNDTGSVSVDKTAVTARPQSSETINFSKTVKAAEGNIMEIEVSVMQQDDTQVNNNHSDTSQPVFERLGAISYKGITLTNEESETGATMPIENQPNIEAPPSPTVKNMNVLSLKSARGVLIPAPPISNSDGKQIIEINLAEYGDVKGLVINNANSGMSVSIDNIRIYDPKASGEYVPVTPVSIAQDAEIEFEGIKIKRETNKIDDLIPGITLNIHDQTDKKESIDVKPDTELVKNTIIEFVGKYNRLLAEINILTQNKPEIIEELTYFTPEEKENAQTILGLMFGDSTLNGLKNRLRSQTSDVYKASESSTIIMLSNMGISTNAGTGGGIETSRLRGYLEIDEKKLDEAIKNNLNEVRSFFGFDSNEDILIDSGLAFNFYTQIGPYVERGGIFGTRIDSLGRKIASTEKKIEDYDKRLAKKEAELKYKYAEMEGTLKDLEEQSNKIKGFAKPSGD